MSNYYKHIIYCSERPGIFFTIIHTIYSYNSIRVCVCVCTWQIVGCRIVVAVVLYEWWRRGDVVGLHLWHAGSSTCRRCLSTQIQHSTHTNTHTQLIANKLKRASRIWMETRNPKLVTHCWNIILTALFLVLLKCSRLQTTKL